MNNVDATCLVCGKRFSWYPLTPRVCPNCVLPITTTAVPRSAVYAAIDSERAYQVQRAEEVSGPGTGEHAHSVEEFVLYMDDYFRELKTQLARTWTPDGQVPAALDTLRKITAMGVACMEQHGAPLRQPRQPADALRETLRKALPLL